MTSMNSTTNPQEPIRNMADKLPFEPNRTAEFDGNQYFVLNVVNPDSATKTKDDIIAIRGIGGDVDPCDPEYPFAQERERLAKLGTQLGYDVEYPASVLIDSGNGLQPIYLLAEPLALPLVGDPGRAPLIERVEQLGRRLANVLGGDRVQNIDRLYRQPGTDNYPNEKKRARGRVKSRSAIVSSSPRRYSGLDELEAVVSHLEATIPPAGLTRAATPRSDNTGSVQRDPQAVNAMIATLTAADIRSTADLDPKLKARLDQLAAPVSYGTDAASLMSAASKLKWRGLTDVEIALTLSAHQSMGKWVETGREADVHRHIARAVIGASGPGEADKPASEKLRGLEPPPCDAAGLLPVETYGSRWANVTARSPWDGWHQPPATFWDTDKTLPRSPDGNVVMDYAGYAQHKTNVVVVECLEAVRDHGAKVLFCAGEAAHQFETERLPAACQAIGMDIEILTGSFWVAPICPDLRDPADVAGLFQWAASQGIEPSIVVVDTLAEATVGAEENSQKDVGPIMCQSYRIAKHWKALVRLIHHKTKSARPGEGGPRGGGGFAGGLDGMRECIYHEKDGTVEIWAEKVKGARAHFSIYRGTPKILVRNPVTGTTKEIMTVKRLTEAEQKAAAKKTEPTRGTVTGSAIGKALAYLKAVEGVSVPTPMLAGAIAGNGADKHTVAAVVKALGRGIADGSFLPYVTFMPDAGSRKPARWSLPDAQEE